MTPNNFGNFILCMSAVGVLAVVLALFGVWLSRHGR